MNEFLKRAALVAASVFCICAPTLADDNGNTLSPLEMLKAVDRDTLASVERLVQQDKKSEGIQQLAADSILTEDEAIFLVNALETAMKRRAAAGPQKAPTIEPGTPAAEVMDSLAPEVREEIMALIAARKKIPAIRELRAATGLGLKDSKDIVEAIMYPAE